MKSYPFILAGALMLTACGPIYETRYDYEPRNANHYCLMDCSDRRQRCESEQTHIYLHCQRNADRDYRDCMDQGRECHWSKKHHRYKCEDPICIKEDCEKDFSPCVDVYNLCYQSCGGAVSSYTVCVQNCDQVR